MEPSNYDIFVSMATREIENTLAQYGLLNNSMVRAGWNMAKEYGTRDPRIRTFIETHILRNPQSVAAGTEVLKDGLGAKLDDFSAKLQAKLESNNAPEPIKQGE